VTIESEPSEVEDFERWYEEEHLREKLAEPGFVHARRFRLHDDPSKCLVVYELKDPAVAIEPGSMKRGKNWSQSVWVAV